MGDQISVDTIFHLERGGQLKEHTLKASGHTQAVGVHPRKMGGGR